MNTSKFLYAEFEALPGHADTVTALVEEYGRTVRAEPGNRRFDAHRLADRPEHFFVYEEYASDVAFRAHVEADYCHRFNEALQPLVAGGGSTLTWLEPVG
jgi:quinol monooxygenase YgiN